MTFRFFLAILWATQSSFVGAQSAGQPLQTSKAGRESKLAGQPVLKWRMDLGNTGWNPRENYLTTSNVNSNSFGKLWERVVDGQVYSQPLYAPNLQIAGAQHNVVFVATEHNSVYAFDADTDKKPNDLPLWKRSLGTSVSSTIVGCGDLTPEYGITSTPVIDLVRHSMYVVAKTLEAGRQVWRLHCLDIFTGKEVGGWGFPINGSYPPGNPNNRFDPTIEFNRCGLALANGRIYVGFGSHCDIRLANYHGWLFAFNAKDSEAKPIVWNTTPSSNGSQEAAGGIWMSGGSPAFDAVGDMFLMTGNGPMVLDLGGPDAGNAFVKLRTRGGSALQLTGDPKEYFCPSNQAYLDAVDADLGSGGLALIPEQTGTTTPRLLVGGGKDGLLRLLNRDDMGGFTGRTDPNAPNNVLQEVGFPNGFWSSPAYADAGAGHCVYANAVGDTLKQFQLGTDGSGSSKLFFVAASPTGTGYPSSSPVVSSRGSAAGTGIVWILNRASNALHAYDATNVSFELYNSEMNTARDTIGPVIKFTVPAVTNGKVYVGADGKLIAYGLLTKGNRIGDNAMH